MAKQSKAKITKRKEQLVAAGYAESDIINDVLEKVENETEGNWPGVFEDLKKKKEDEHIPFTEAEHLDPDPVPPTANLQELVIRVEKEAETGISTIEANKAKIAEWKKEYASLKFTSLEDTETNNKIIEGWRLARTTRLALEKREGFLKAPFIAASKKIGGVAAEYYALLAEIENPMKEQRDALEAAKEEEKNKAALAAEAEATRRVEALKESGMKFDGTFYVIGETISVDYSTIKAMPEDEFEKFHGKVQAENKRLDELEAKRLEDLKKERLSTRGNMLLSIGMTMFEVGRQDGKGINVIDFEGYESEHLEGVKVFMSCLADEPDDKFMTLFSSLSSRIADAKKKAQEEIEKKAKERAIALRSKIILAIGMQRVDWIPGSTQTGFYFKNDFVECKLPLPEVESMADEVFDHFIEVTEGAIIDAKANQFKKEEDDRKAAQLAGDRGNQLIALGMTRAPQQEAFVFNLPDGKFECKVPYSLLTSADEEKWNEAMTATAGSIETLQKQQQEAENKRQKEKQEQEEKQAKDALTFQERQYKLVNLGMVIVGNAFFIKNEFNDQAAITVDEVKVIDEDAWPRRLTEVTAEVDKVKALTEQKRQEAIARAELLKPEVTRVREYLASMLDIAIPEITDQQLEVIMIAFKEDLGSAIIKANKALEQVNN